MSDKKVFMIDGIDRLGKSTLIKGIQHELGYHQVIHFDKPQLLRCYQDQQGYGLHSDAENKSLRDYQRVCNRNMFKMAESGARIIFDRTHLGEMVYAPRYRGYNGDYIYEEEVEHDTSQCRLILLITTDFSFQQDDGESFDWSNRVEEQQDFIKAFMRSSIEDKVMIDINSGKGKYRNHREILAEALKISVQDLVHIIR